MSIFKVKAEIEKTFRTEKTLNEIIIKRPTLNEDLVSIYNVGLEEFDVEFAIWDPVKKRKIITVPGENGKENDLSVDIQMIQPSDLLDVLTYQKNNSKILFEIATKSFPDISIDYELINGSLFKEEGTASWTKTLNQFQYEKTNQRSPIKQENEILSLIQTNHTIWIHNASCTGKTWTSITIINRLGNKNKYYFNARTKDAISVIQLLILLVCARNVSIIFDDMQCSPEVSLNILKYIKQNLQSIKDRNIYLCLVSWDSFANAPLVNDYLSYIPSADYSGPDIYFLKNKIRNNGIKEYCKDNILLLNNACNMQWADKKLTLESFKKRLFSSYVATDNRELLQRIAECAVLGFFDLDIPISLYSGNIEEIEQVLPTAKVIKDSLSIAHRDVCRFILEYINEQYNIRINYEEILSNYFNILQGTEKRKALLHLTSNVEGNQSFNISNLSLIWTLLNDLVDYLEEKSDEDPSWDNTPSAMRFVIITADFLKETDKFKSVIDEFCKCFPVINGEIQFDYASYKTSFDFGEIKKRMIQEDEKTGNVSGIGYELGSEIDEDLMHRNWLLGLIVSLRNVLIQYGYQQISDAALSELIKSQNLEGYWYPRRVPWVTACAVQNLAKANIKLDSEKYKNIVKYLFDIKGKDNSHWDARTGGWNSSYETTVLCLDAIDICSSYYMLSKRQKNALNKSIEFLESEVDEWKKEEKWIDGTVTACYLLSKQGASEELIKYVESVAQNNIISKLQRNSIVLDTQQTASIAMITYYLTEMSWTLLENELPVIIQSFIESASKKIERIPLKKEPKESDTIDQKESAINHDCDIIDEQVPGGKSPYEDEKLLTELKKKR